MLMLSINFEAMEEQIFKILRENKIGHAKAHFIKHELLNLYSVMPCDHRYHSRNGRYMLYEGWCEKCGSECHEE